ncbi:hypothetical protein [Microbulbifer sp. ZKSA002]
MKRFYFESVKNLVDSLSWYPDRYYNLKRRHSSLGLKSADEYERMAT